MKQLIKNVEKISSSMDLIAAGCFFAVMALIIANILLRGIFKKPILGNYELVGYLTALGVSFALAHCARIDGHIAVDFFVGRLPKAMQKAVSMLVATLSVCLWGGVIWSMFTYANSMRAIGLVSATAQIAVYPIIGLVTIGLVGFWLVLLLQWVQHILGLSLAVKFARDKKVRHVSELAKKAV
ncbi:MAG: TRAP transporter small permease [Clostridiales bacterium]|jgi:TRAP-type C4-dicarboxylate transport system permease small subunit|nr:TRAP transporter small permease [Clostridiales bacterium]